MQRASRQINQQFTNKNDIIRLLSDHMTK